MEIADKGPEMMGALWTFQFIAFTLAGLRFYARLAVMQTYGWDDILFGISVALLLVYNALLTVAATHGLGQMAADTLWDQAQALLYINIAQSILSIASITVKLSIAVFLYRLVASNRPQRLAIMIPAIVLTMILIAALLILWFSCTPLSYGWNWYLVQGNCDDGMQFAAVVVGGCSILLIEVFYATFSWFLIRGLQMPRTERITIGACMSVGYFSAVCSIYRLVKLLDLALYTGTDESYLYIYPDVLIWHAADVISQLICITVTVCRPLYKDWLNTLIGHVTTTVRSSFSSNTGTRRPAKSGASGSEHSMMALQTIGGSSVTPKKERVKADGKNPDAGGVTIERSWIVESNSRDTLFPTDGESEELMLGNTGVAEVEIDRLDPAHSRSDNV